MKYLTEWWNLVESTEWWNLVELGGIYKFWWNRLNGGMVESVEYLTEWWNLVELGGIWWNLR